MFLKFKVLICLLYLLLRSNILFSSPDSLLSTWQKTNAHKNLFIENKGQVSDQNYKPRLDVLFGGTADGIVFHLKNNGISYQFNKVDSWEKFEISKNKYFDTLNNKSLSLPKQITFYRLDINWLNCNASPQILKENALQEYANYYLEVCPNGVNGVKSYEQITYQNIYNGVDLKWYQKNGHLKYDYYLNAGIDYKQIQFEIKGAKNITINNIGELVIETPLGTIIEEAPLVKQNNKILKSNWVIKNNSSDTLTTSIISFNIKNINSKLPFIIDPGVRTWGTYYGGFGDDQLYNTTVDINNDVYASGFTSTTTGTVIATSGSYQNVMGFPGGDAYLVKFNSAGVRLWATYYGGLDNEFGNSCITDGQANVYMTGNSTSFNAVSTVGCHQPNHAGVIGDGNTDAYIVKFNSAGVRQWATYYGGINDEVAYSCSIDSQNNVYMAGLCELSNGNIIATPGSHQPTFVNGNDAFLVKFNSNGQRQWGTYYGDVAFDAAYSCATDKSDNIYICGVAASNPASTVIATPGSHQFSCNAAGDGFLAKFNSAGVRQWGTFYGGTGTDEVKYCAVDANRNIYITGETNSSVINDIATTGSHQQTFGGSKDAFLAKFDSAGVRQWATYYGGSGIDRAWSCTTDIVGNVLVAGNSDSNTMISTPGSHQSVLGGGECDAFLVKFNLSGNRQWATYYGGSVQLDYGRTVSADNTGNIYLGGFTATSVGISIATANGHQPSFGGQDDGYLAQFFDCLSYVPVNVTPVNNQIICSNNSTTLFATGSNTINWFANATSTNVLGTGTVFTTPLLNAGTYTFFAEATNCALTPTRIAVTVTVNPIPTLNIASSSTSLCSGQSATLNVSGAISYTWLPGSIISSSLFITPPLNQTYTVSGINSFACKNNSQITISVTPTPTLMATPLFYLCSGNATLNATGAQTYSWFPGSLTGSIVLVSPSATTNYTLVGANGVCTNSAISTVSLGIAPPLIISANSQSGCKGTCFTFSNSSNSYTTFTYSWGDSTATIPLITNHCYSNSGNYQVIAQAIYSTGCSAINVNTINITIFPSPISSISINTTGVFSINTPITINNTSSGAQNFVWSFGDNSPNQNASFLANIVHTYTTAGSYCIKLTATDTIFGCKDSTNLCVDILCLTEINLPNIFTPNNDGVNDVFRFKNTCVKSLKCTVFNRWGVKIFDWQTINGFWDGRTTSGELCSSGTYFYVLEYIDSENNIVKKNGYICLFN